MTDERAILVINTGGTIGMVKDTVTGALRPIDFGQLYEQIPVLKKIPVTIDCYTFDPLIDSSNMNPSNWIRLAEVIEENYEKYDGFVILHGSDTMAYSASGLSFILENLNKPVVFTGSQLPLGVVRTDGRENLITSIEVASAYDDDTAIVPEVTIYFENNLLRGNRTHKYNAEHFNAFHSDNYPALASAGVHIKYHYNYIHKPNFKKLKVHKNLDTNLVVIKLFPGINRQAILSMLHIEGLKAAVLETFGTGNAPTDPWLLSDLKEAIGRGVVILNVTQCNGGSVMMGKYQTSVGLGRIGVISGWDITTESAIAKLMYLLGENLTADELSNYLNVSLRGEMTVMPS
jgi:L-asparaginase